MKWEVSVFFGGHCPNTKFQQQEIVWFIWKKNLYITGYEIVYFIYPLDRMCVNWNKKFPKFLVLSLIFPILRTQAPFTKYRVKTLMNLTLTFSLFQEPWQKLRTSLQLRMSTRMTLTTNPLPRNLSKKL